MPARVDASHPEPSRTCWEGDDGQRITVRFSSLIRWCALPRSCASHPATRARSCAHAGLCSARRGKHGAPSPACPLVTARSGASRIGAIYVCARSRSRMRAVFPVCCLISPLPPAPRACLCVSRQRPAPRSHPGRAANDTESDADHAAKRVLWLRLCMSWGPPVREDRKGRASSPRRSRPTRAVPLSCGGNAE